MKASWTSSWFHNAFHDAFMTLPPYTQMREGEVPQLGCGPKPLSVGPWSEAMSSSETVKNTLGNSSGTLVPAAMRKRPCMRI
jgi:hypothetical protein